jgi:hypothetical protein
MNVTERRALIKATDELNAMKSGDDEEFAHERAEKILCELLKDIGYGDAADAFKAAGERVEFWYA